MAPRPGEVTLPSHVPRPLRQVLMLAVVGHGVGELGGGVRADRLSLQDDGEICINSMQCSSKCCQHDTILGIARCTHKAIENSECSPQVYALQAWGNRGGLHLDKKC